MNKTYLVFDVHNLSWRAFHAMGGTMSYNGDPTGVYYNVLGTILQAQGKFNTERCLFAFDSRNNKRKEIRKTYKANRSERSPEELDMLISLIQQILKLRKIHLPAIGFRNFFSQQGYEADDIIASLCQNLPDTDRAVIVSTDSDLLQLLNSRVQVYDPKKQMLWTRKAFQEVYGIKASQWATVKAIAGCSTDGVKGIPGVGEKGVIQYLNGTLKETTKKYLAIVSEEGVKIRKRNMRLVKLPLEGTNVFKIRKEGKHDWSPTLKSLGIKSLKPKELEYRGLPNG